MLGSAGCGASISSVSAQTIASARSGLVADLVTVTDSQGPEGASTFLIMPGLIRTT